MCQTVWWTVSASRKLQSRPVINEVHTTGTHTCPFRRRVYGRGEERDTYRKTEDKVEGGRYRMGGQKWRLKET